MNYKQATKDFVENILSSVPSHDIPAKREAWGIYIDGLCKSGQITQKQYETWDNPKQVNK